MSSVAKAVSTKVEWATIISKLGLTGSTASSLNAFKKRHDEAKKEYLTLSQQPTTVDFEHYKTVLNNKKVVEDIAKKVGEFKPATYDVSKTLKTIEVFEAKAIENAKLTEKSVLDEINQLNTTLKDIENSRPFDQLTVDDVAKARPDLDDKVNYMIKNGKWNVPGYKEKFGDLTVIPTTVKSEPRSHVIALSDLEANKAAPVGQVQPSQDNDTAVASPICSWDRFPVYSMMLGWVILNGIYSFKDPINKAKNIVALVFYLMGHVLVVPATAWYLYLFQPSRILKLFVIAIGVQSICVNITHLVFPNVPPIYIQYYGENKNATYDSPGYSEGLTRIELNFPFGRVLNFFIIYVKSIEFGILPSLHSCMSLTSVYFLVNLISIRVMKVALLVYSCFQIWSSLYLDHHWRVDILFSVFYSMFSYLMVKDKLVSIRSQFRYDAKFGRETTMGMRVFHGTGLEWWFTPT
ncbi:hypothetical protein PSN45_000492 [Yamadazyma tenuis]|uniref:uncharacterized protein n=1 Tax=Candida tenuis TaxID=2315449 RepID=UPI0027A9D270|nr:hypothetical protein PSN45_000492 [Yamadazyma tenuis]